MGKDEHSFPRSFDKIRPFISIPVSRKMPYHFYTYLNRDGLHCNTYLGGGHVGLNSFHDLARERIEFGKEMY